MVFKGPAEPLGALLEGAAEPLDAIFGGLAEPLGAVLGGSAEPLFVSEEHLADSHGLDSQIHQILSSSVQLPLLKSYLSSSSCSFSSHTYNGNTSVS